MSRHAYTAFQKHLLFFSTPTNPPNLTLLSSLRAALSLGLNLPIALFLSISLRFLYAPYPFFFSPINIEEIPSSSHRTQLLHAKLLKPEYTCTELISLLNTEPEKNFVKRAIDQGHVVGFWTMAATTRSHLVSRGDVERFQRGDWEHVVAKRRRGREDILPLWRGGPMWVAGHSWAVSKIFGVRVYDAKTSNQ